MLTGAGSERIVSKKTVAVLANIFRHCRLSVRCYAAERPSRLRSEKADLLTQFALLYVLARGSYGTD